MECYMDNCGFISINEYICENCCIRRNIMKLNKSYERLSLENEEFKQELSFFKKNIIQITSPDSDFNYWVEFGNGVYLCDLGIKNNASIIFTIPKRSMNLILEGKLEAFEEFFNGNLKIKGDLQYGTIFFDIIKLASEIMYETGGA
jgi:predicted lipid carrier protein YhbT